MLTVNVQDETRSKLSPHGASFTMQPNRGLGGVSVDYTTDYFWVVLCQNHRFHHKDNTGYEHRILLGETDAFSSQPMLPERIKVRCDSCGKAYSYKRSEILRAEVQVPDAFVPHPLFKKPA
jgi:hypothetical protein